MEFLFVFSFYAALAFLVAWAVVKWLGLEDDQ